VRPADAGTWPLTRLQCQPERRGALGSSPRPAAAAAERAAPCQLQPVHCGRGGARAGAAKHRPPIKCHPEDVVGTFAAIPERRQQQGSSRWDGLGCRALKEQSRSRTAGRRAAGGETPPKGELLADVVGNDPHMVLAVVRAQVACAGSEQPPGVSSGRAQRGSPDLGRVPGLGLPSVQGGVARQASCAAARWWARQPRATYRCRSKSVLGRRTGRPPCTERARRAGALKGKALRAAARKEAAKSSPAPKCLG
jgi:hypothetical protein